MIEDNTSMEEDTELRELVVQTLENNGVLAKVRAELRASVFLTLEEQESVLNPEPLLNKSVKQCLAHPQGKLLFSLVREFLEYFGLDYTISVYDPETYFGKDYNYVGRKKLCEEFGIDSKEPLLGELLKNTINSALSNSQTIVNESCINESYQNNKSTENPANVTFDVSVPTITQKNSESDCDEISEKLDNISVSNLDMPINVKTGKKSNDFLLNHKNTTNSLHQEESIFSDQIDKNSPSFIEQNNFLKDTIEKHNIAEKKSLKTNSVITDQVDIHVNKEINLFKRPVESQPAINVKNIQVESINKSFKTVYFDEIIVDGVKEKLEHAQNDNLSLKELPPLINTTNSSILSDLPPLNGKKTNINDLKELMDIAQGVSQYEDFTSSTSGSEHSPLKVQFPSQSSETNINKVSTQPIPSENENEELEKEVQSNISCHKTLMQANNEKVTITATDDCPD